MFYTFDQNNSGGRFDYDEACGITTHVIIEADNATEANSIAENIGLYFNGCDAGYDCPCCGDRWYPQYSDDRGAHSPEVYGQPVETLKSAVGWSGKKGEITRWVDGYEIFVHYKDGTIKGFVK